MAAVGALYGRRLFQAAISVEDDLYMPWLHYFSGKVCDEFRRGGQVKGICLFEMKPLAGAPSRPCCRPGRAAAAAAHIRYPVGEHRMTPDGTQLGTLRQPAGLDPVDPEGPSPCG
jgi:hypothetical protein